MKGLVLGLREANLSMMRPRSMSCIVSSWLYPPRKGSREQSVEGRGGTVVGGASTRWERANNADRAFGAATDFVIFIVTVTAINGPPPTFSDVKKWKLNETRFVSPPP